MRQPKDHKGGFLWTRHQVNKLKDAHALELAAKDATIEELKQKVLDGLEVMSAASRHIDKHIDQFRKKPEPVAEAAPTPAAAPSDEAAQPAAA